MTQAQKWIKNGAIALAILLAVSIIGSALTAAITLVGWLGGDGILDEMKTYSVSSEVTSLEMELGGTEVQIKTGKALSVESNLKHLTVEEKDGCLRVEQTGQTGMNFDDALLILYLPADFSFREAEIETGAGRLAVQVLSAGKLTLDLGAGEVVIDDLRVMDSCQINGGAGAVTVKNGAIHNLNMDMGVGQLILTAKLTGSCGMDLGVGQTELTLLGAREDYRIKIDKGVGSAEIDGESATNGQTYGTGDVFVAIDGGVGSIEVEFE